MWFDKTHHKITVDVFGGLGNQMFQYALGRRLSLKNGIQLTLCHIDAGAFSKREYALGCFKLAEGTQVKSKVVGKKSEVWEKLRELLGIGEAVVRENGFPFDPKILEQGGGVHLSGYWQSEKYFKDIRETLLDDFTFVPSLSSRNRKLLEEIQSVHSVSVHIRRGDYVVDPQTNKFHGVYGPDYYERAFG